MTNHRITRFRYDGITLIALVIFLSWVLVSLAWLRRDNPGHLLWFCDVALLITAIGLFFRSGLLVTAQLTAILVFHFVWNLDFWLYFIFGFMPIGSTAYMFYQDLGLFEKCLSFFSHVFIVPFVMFGIIVLGVHRRAWLIQWVQTFLIFLCTFLFTRPEENINWVFGTEVFNISPTIIHPIMYYILMITLTPLVIFLPSNVIAVKIFERKNHINRKNPAITGISLFSTLLIIFMVLLVSITVSYIADKKCALDLNCFQVNAEGSTPLEDLPLTAMETHLNHIIFGEKDNMSEVPMLPWFSPKLPKQWSGFDCKMHIHTKSLLLDISSAEIPSVPQEVLLLGKRSIPGSVVWAFVASDSYYVQNICDLNRTRNAFEVQCAVGGRGISEYLNPSNGEVYQCNGYNEILGKGTGAIYALGVVEVVGNKVVARSPYYIVKRKGIRHPEDIWFITRGDSLFALLSNPANPKQSHVAFQSCSSKNNSIPDIYICNYFGYDIRNLTNSPERFDGFVSPNGETSEGIGWVGTKTIRYCSERGKQIILSLD